MSTKVPPDGGWGWIIVLANALNGISTIPIIQVFGLIFKDSFVKLNLNATDTSIIINVNLAFGMLFGIINGPLLKTFGYKKVAIAGSITYTVGIILTAFARTFTLFIICYGILTSIGLGMSMSGFSLALNSYFTTKRNRAMGLAITIIGLGPILMPQVVSFLLTIYSIQETVLLLGAFSFHSMIGAILLQPIKWHMKRVSICLETIPEKSKIFNNNEEGTLTHKEEDEADVHSSRLTLNNYQRKRKTTISSIDHDIEVGSIYGFDTPLPRQISIDKTTYDTNYDIEMSIIKGTSMVNSDDSRKCLKYSLGKSAKSVESINLGSSIKIFDEPVPLTKKLTFIDNTVNKSNDLNQNIMEKNSLLEKETSNCSNEENHDEDDRRDESAIYRILRRVANLYDFDLLRDPIYINIMLGMSIAIFAEVNFSLLTPFILADMGMTTAKIANIMSIIAIADLVGRGVSPYLGEWLRQPSRMMYMLSLVLLIISRASLLFTNSFSYIIIVAIGLGLAKGIRSVYMTLIVPNYVSIQKLPTASGIQMLTNGVILMCAGPTLGLIRDSTGNYTVCIILINFVTAITLFIWTIEILLVRRKSARQKSRLLKPS